LIPRLTIFEKALIRDIFKAFLLVVLILLLIIFAAKSVKILEEISEGAISANIFFGLLGIEMIKVLGVILPPAFFFGIIWSLAALYRDSEIVALQASGVSLLRLFQATLYLALPVAFLAGFLSFQAIPWAQQAKDDLKAIDEARSDISFVQPGKFNEFRKGDLVVYAENVDKTTGRLQQVFVQDRQNGRSGIIKSEEAWQFLDTELNGRFVVLSSGVRYVGNPGELNYQVSSFDEYILRLDAKENTLHPTKTSAYSMGALIDSPLLPSKAEFAYRVSVPLGVIVFTVLAFVLSKAEPRKEVHGRLGFAILTYFIFFNLQRVGERWIVQDVVPHQIGLFWLLALMLGIAGIVMFFDSVKWRKLRQQLLSGVKS